MDTIKLIGKYLNVPVGTVCYNTDKVCKMLRVKFFSIFFGLNQLHFLC